MSRYSSAGVKEVAVSILQALEDLSDVEVSSPADGEALVYSDGEWINGAVASSANVTADTHPSTENAANDEFEYGTTIDTTGARFSGATPWSWMNQAGGSTAVSNGSLQLSSDKTGTSTSVQAVYQPVSGSTWTYTAKISGISGNTIGMMVGSAAGKFYVWCFGTNALNLYAFDNSTTYASNPVSVAYSGYLTDATSGRGSCIPIYLQISYDGTNIYFRWSTTGIPGSFGTVYTVEPSVFLGAVPADIGLEVTRYSVTYSSVLVCDWFRQTA